MPQNITASTLNTITLALNDLATIKFYGRGNLSIMNYGPGKVTFSNNPAITPVAGAANCLLLGSGIGYTRTDVPGDSTVLLIADTASTIVSISYL